MTLKNLVSDDIKLQALIVAQNIIRHKGSVIFHKDLKSLHGFISKISSPKTKNKITQLECDRVINIAKKYL